MITAFRAAAIGLALGGAALCLTASTSFAAPVRKAPAQKASTAKAAKPAPRARAATPRPEPIAAAPSLESVAQMLNWITASGDNGGLPFMVIDKVAAEVVVFDADGKLLGATPALVGITPGDDSSPGVGDRELSDIAPDERTTPAGRFVSRFGTAAGNRKVLWVDYTTSISLHPVITTNKKERRLQRIKSPTPDDNRITFGCINVPARFYTRVVVPVFKSDIGVVYILPETRSLAETFPAFQGQEMAPPHRDVSR